MVYLQLKYSSKGKRNISVSTAHCKQVHRYCEQLCIWITSPDVKAAASVRETRLRKTAVLLFAITFFFFYLHGQNCRDLHGPAGNWVLCQSTFLWSLLFVNSITALLVKPFAVKTILEWFTQKKYDKWMMDVQLKRPQTIIVLCWNAPKKTLTSLNLCFIILNVCGNSPDAGQVSYWLHRNGLKFTSIKWWKIYFLKKHSEEQCLTVACKPHVWGDLTQ